MNSFSFELLPCTQGTHQPISFPYTLSYPLWMSKFLSQLALYFSVKTLFPLISEFLSLLSAWNRFLNQTQSFWLRTYTWLLCTQFLLYSPSVPSNSVGLPWQRQGGNPWPGRWHGDFSQLSTSLMFGWICLLTFAAGTFLSSMSNTLPKFWGSCKLLFCWQRPHLLKLTHFEFSFSQ